MRASLIVASIAVVVWSARPAVANERSQALRREGYEAAYNLDRDRAVDLFRQAVAADPNDAASYRAAAVADWLQVLFLRGTVTVEDYMGHISSRSDIKMPAVPPALAASFHANIRRAIDIGETSVSRRYRDAGSHYDLGAALGLYASYAGTIEGKVFVAMRTARRAFSEHEMALDLDPKRRDAGLVSGTYRYLISTLPAALRWMAYIVGFGGGKAEGLRLIEDAAAFPSDVQTDARMALVLIYNRETRYDDALRVVRQLEHSYPRNRLLQLEEGSTALRAKRPAEAERVLDEGLARLQADPRPRMAGEEGRWRYKRGAARLLLGRLSEAEADLRAAMAAPGVRDWVRARIHVELGKLADLQGNRSRARTEYQTALALAETANDKPAAGEATRWLAQPYRQ